jgi:zinc transport system permease protein
MLDFLQYGFIQNAFILGIALGISAALLSPYLVLNQQAMIADGLAHISFSGIILGTLLVDEPLYVALPFVMFASLLIKYLATKRRINGDAAIGIVSAVSFAIGLILVKQGQGFNISVESLIVGNIFIASRIEVILSVIITGIIFIFIILAYRPLLLLTYDVEYATFAKVKVTLLNYVLAALTSFFIVIGVRTIGVLLISALTIFPSIIASQWTKSFKNTLKLGVLISIFVVIVGIFVAHPLAFPVGSTIVLVYALTLLISLIIKPLLRRS